MAGLCNKLSEESASTPLCKDEYWANRPYGSPSFQTLLLPLRKTGTCNRYGNTWIGSLNDRQRIRQRDSTITVIRDVQGEILEEGKENDVANPMKTIEPINKTAASLNNPAS